MSELVKIGNKVYKEVGTVAQQGSSKPKAKPPAKPKPKGMSKRQRDNVIRNWLLMFLAVWEVAARGYGSWGIVSWIINLIMMKFGYTLDI